MPTDAITGWPFDSSLDAPDGAAQMARLVAAAAGTSGESTPVFRVRDQADRDARFTTPVGLVMTTQAPWMLWMAAGATWLTLYSDTGWVTNGFAPGTNWSLGSYYRASKVAERIYVEGEVNRVNNDLTNGSSWNITDETIITIPPQFAPGGTNNGGIPALGRASFTSVDLQLYPSGQIQVCSLHAGSKVGVGDFLRFAFTFRAAS